MKEIRLIPYSQDQHFDLLVGWLTNEKLMAGWDLPPFSPNKIKEWADDLNKVVLMVVDSGTNMTVGFVNFYDWDKLRGVASRGTVIDPKYQNMGFGKEAILASNEYAFKKMGLKRIELYISGDNKISRHITEKIGYKLDRFDTETNRYYYFMEAG